MEIFAPLVGVGFRGEPARSLVQELTSDNVNQLSFEPEPENEYDNHAVKVIFTDDELGPIFVGYVAKENNLPIFNALVEGRELTSELVGWQSKIKPVLLIKD